MPKYEVEAVFFIEADDPDAAFQALDQRLDALYRRDGVTHAAHRQMFSPADGETVAVTGYEMLEGVATEVAA